VFHHLSQRLGRARLVVIAAALVGGGLAAGGVDAATPTSGTVSPSSPNASFTAGPFAVANTSGNAGPVMCAAPAAPCDNFTLHVNTPAGYGTGHSMNVAVSWPNPAADFDLYLLDASGKQIASSASSADPEVVKVPPTSGTYTVRVVPYAPLGQRITGTISLSANPVQPPPSSAPASGYHNYPAPNSINDAHNAGEPSIGYDTSTNKALYQSYLSTYRVGFDDRTSPATASYVDKSATAAKGCPGGSTTSLDPIGFTDRATHRTFESQLLDLGVSGSQTCFSDDNGDTWSQSQGGGAGSGVDHQTLGGGPFSKTGLGPLTSYPNAVYYCSQDIAEASCSLSQDGGRVFNPTIPMYTIQQCRGLHGHLKVAPDGTVYVPNKNCGGHPAVVVSGDNGLHWAIRPVPTGTAGKSDPSVSIGANGTVYLGWNGANNHAFAAVSHDKGQTWTNVQDIGAQLGIQNSVFPAAVAGDDNRAAVTFIGTATGGNSQQTDVFKGVWQLYVAATYDGGKTYKLSNATGADPVQRGSICVSGTTCGSDRNLLDFIDATVDSQGRVLVGYADGCTAACVTTTNPNASTPGYRDALATIARQDSGLRMFAANDPLPDLTVHGISASRNSSGHEQLSAVLSNIGNAPATGAVVRFLVGCPCKSVTIADTAPITLAAGASQRVTVTWSTAKKGSTYYVTAVADPLNKIRESNENNNRSASQVTVR